VLTFLAWLILLVLCWPLALLALVLYPIDLRIPLPFRLARIAVHGALVSVRAMILPAGLLSRWTRVGEVPASLQASPLVETGSQPWMICEPSVVRPYGQMIVTAFDALKSATVQNPGAGSR
jgi:hypothetical protein